jgi:hypothetical protein
MCAPIRKFLAGKIHRDSFINWEVYEYHQTSRCLVLLAEGKDAKHCRYRTYIDVSNVVITLGEAPSLERTCKEKERVSKYILNPRRV